MENRDRSDLLDLVDKRIVTILGRRKSISDLLVNPEEDQHDDEPCKLLRPLSRVYVTDDEVVVIVDLPCVSKENIEVDAADDSLVIRAKMDHSIKLYNEDGNEAEFEGHCKNIKLPLGIRIDLSKARTIFKNGILEIRLPKKRLGTRINIE